MLARSFYRPWEGRHYSEGGLWDMRILVLGESHYLWSGYGDRNETRQVVRLAMQFEEGHRGRFFKAVAKAFLGQAIDPSDLRSFWQAVAFYNYVQEPMRSSKTRPTPDQWRAAEGPFLATVKALRPQLICVFGRQLWNWLPSTGADGPTLRAGGATGFTYSYPLDASISALAVQFSHASRGFDAIGHHKLIMRALKAAKGDSHSHVGMQVAPNTRFTRRPAVRS